MGFATLLGTSCSHVQIPQNTRKVDATLQTFKQGRKAHFNYKHESGFHGLRLGVPRCCKTIDFDERTSANEVRKEIEQCYRLIHKLGRGVIYIGSSRPGPDHPHYMQSCELSREVHVPFFSLEDRVLLSHNRVMIANLLNCTTWTGAGPGLMDAAIKGALHAGKPVGGFKIEKEAGQWSSTGSHPYLSPETYLTCRFFSARKHGFVDAAVRNSPSDQTAVIALPGGIGTLDEIFEILALIQLQRIGSQLPVPFLLMNYDGYYSKLLGFLQDCEHWGTLAKGEIEPLWKVCEKNEEALTYLARFYNLPFDNVDVKVSGAKVA